MPSHSEVLSPVVHYTHGVGGGGGVGACTLKLGA